MVKEEKKKERFGPRQTFPQIIAGYLRTVALSFFVALLFTVLLSFHARSEMIKNIYTSGEERQKMNEQVAR